MRITIISVQNNKVPGKKYTALEVAYKNDRGEIKGRKVLSFSVKKGLDLLKDAREGDMLDIELVKDGEYWNWVGVAKADGSQPATTASTVGKTYSSGGSDRESKEERAARQVLIVRQSCLSTAVALYAIGKVVPAVQDVIDVAKYLEQFVFGNLADAPQGAEAETVE